MRVCKIVLIPQSGVQVRRSAICCPPSFPGGKPLTTQLPWCSWTGAWTC